MAAQANNFAAKCQDETLAHTASDSYNSNMSISIIVPTYNRKSLLFRALDSVVNQTYLHWDLTVIDDGSTDGTAESFAQWRQQKNADLKIQFHRAANGGVSRARNLGVQMSSAPWIAFLDSDDEWLPDKLTLQIELAGKFSLIHGEEIWIRNGVRVNPKQKHSKSGGSIFTRCVDLCCISPSTVLLRRDLLLLHNGFREDFEVCEDYDLWLKICAENPVGFINSPVIRKHGGHLDQLSLRFKAMDYWRVKALIPFLRQSSPISESDRLYVAEQIKKKCEILIAGFLKHQNTAQLSEVQAWLACALRLGKF